MGKKSVLRDLIYFDFDKAASICSQLEDGLIQEIQSGGEINKDNNNSQTIDLKLLKAEFGGIAGEKSSELISKVLHHNLLVKIEENLFKNEFAIDINNEINTPEDLSVEIIHSKIDNKAYIRAEGWAVIEDYERFKRMANNFNDISTFLNKCTITSNPEYIQKVKEINSNSNISKKRKDELFKELNKTAIEPLADWYVNGLKLFIDTFMAQKIIFRVYPFESVPDFQIIANLKKNAFIDTDLENVTFAYNTQPNIKLSIFGLITSNPMEPEKSTFDPMTEFSIDAPYESEQKNFEKAFRQAFQGISGFDKFLRYSRYPNITVYPIAVYRMLQSTK